jgi:hypothetical protein
MKIPDTDSIRELAEFWDTHDVTDFDDQLEEVAEPVFVRPAVTVPLSADERPRSARSQPRVESMRSRSSMRGCRRSCIADASSALHRTGSEGTERRQMHHRAIPHQRRTMHQLALEPDVGPLADTRERAAPGARHCRDEIARTRERRSASRPLVHRSIA